MGESWFQREFLTPRRLAFNVLFYGAHFALFAYGWWSQVSASTLSSTSYLFFPQRQPTSSWLVSTL